MTELNAIEAAGLRAEARHARRAWGDSHDKESRRAALADLFELVDDLTHALVPEPPRPPTRSHLYDGMAATPTPARFGLLATPRLPVAPAEAGLTAAEQKAVAVVERTLSQIAVARATPVSRAAWADAVAPADRHPAVHELHVGAPHARDIARTVVAALAAENLLRPT